MDIQEEKPRSRREFLAWVWMGAGLFYSAGVAGFIGFHFLYPKPAKKERTLFVSMLAKLPAGSITQVSDPSGSEIFLHNIGGKIIALSNVCTHLGCKVRWEKEKNRFYCPCHGGTFNQNGVPTGGPPTIPLKRFETLIRGEAVYIRWKEI